MSTYQIASATDLLNAINTANGTSFLASDLSFSVPQETDGTWQGANTDRNTAVLVTANGVTYQGNIVVLYDRLDISQIVNLPGFSVAAYQAESTWQLLPAIAYFTGIQFAESDLINNPINDLVNGAGAVTLEADPNSLGWINSVTFNITQGGLGLDVAITEAQLPGLNYPVADASGVPGTAVQGPAYLYAYDFTANTATFLTWTAGVLSSGQSDTLVTAINAVDIGSGAGLWNDATTGSTENTWNVAGATIIFNGLNDPSTMPTNPNYKYVMQLQLAANVTIPSGDLYLHYNDPFNPDDF